MEKNYKLYMKMETNEEGKKKVVFETYDIDSIIRWTITALYDGAVKRNKIKIEQYYGDNGKEYCRIKATYKRIGVDYEEIKETYTIENWRNDWGNFIDVYDTFYDNNIEIPQFADKGVKNEK